MTSVMLQKVAQSYQTSFCDTTLGIYKWVYALVTRYILTFMYLFPFIGLTESINHGDEFNPISSDITLKSPEPQNYVKDIPNSVFTKYCLLS